MLLSIPGPIVELRNVAFEVESVEAAGKIGFRLFDVVATVVVEVFDHVLAFFSISGLKFGWKIVNQILLLYGIR